MKWRKKHRLWTTSNQESHIHLYIHKECPMAQANKIGIRFMIFILIFLTCKSMLYMIFQYGWEPVVIQWILFGLEAILEKYIPGSSIRRPSGCSKPHRYRRCCYWWIYPAVPAKIISQLIVPAKIVIAAESVIVAWPLIAKANIFILRFKKCMMMPIKLGTI